MLTMLILALICTTLLAELRHLRDGTKGQAMSPFRGRESLPEVLELYHEFYLST